MIAPEQGATPTELRLRVLANGWSPLPVAGKAPTPTDWSRYCRAPATDGEIVFWGRSHPGAASTGLALGHEVGIDIDVASDAALAATVRGIAVEVFGTTPFERVGNAPKTCLVFRAAPDVVSSSHKASSGNGDGVDVLADGRQVVAFGLHRDTRQPYRWTGAASPLDARPDAAPVITGGQVDEFLLRVEAVMPLHGGGPAGGGARKGKGGTSREIVRDASGRVVDGREQFLMHCVWRAANRLHQAKADLTAEAVAEAAWGLFTDPERGAVLDDGRWTKGDATRKAKLTLRRVEAGTIELGEAPEQAPGEKVAPTYPDRAVPIGEARAAVQDAIEAHFAAGEGHRAIRVGTGIGKTRAAVRAVAGDVRRRRAEGDRGAALYLVPTHKLADEVADLFRAEGVTARVFRGRNAPDPDAPDADQRMCLDMEAVDLALSLGRTVSTSCCRGEHPTTGTPVHCPLFNDCAYQRQIRDTPAVWVGAHDLLFSAPGGLGHVSAVVVDEGFWGAGIRISTKGIPLDEVGAPPPLGRNVFEDYAAADVAAWRAQLGRALARQEGLGGVERRHLVAEGLTVELCTSANKAEWRLKEKAQLWPGMGQQARRAAMKLAETAGKVGRVAPVWAAARELLRVDDEGAVSGRLTLAEVTSEDGFGKARVVRTHGVRKVLDRWLDVPVLLLDATLPSLDVLRAFFPDVEIAAEVDATAPHARVRQVLGAPVSAGKLMGSKAGRNREAVRRAVLHRFVRAGRPSTLVVLQKEAAEWLRGTRLPAGITVGHYGALAGLDGFKGVGLLIAIGRTMPSVTEVETYAGAVTGLDPLRTAEPAKGPRWYDRAALGLRLADGSGRAVQGDRHPDPVAEAVRWQVAEAGVLQAIGRARAVNRTAADPVSVEIWNDLVLPMTVDEVAEWDAIPSGYDADMLADGVVLESPSDMAACWPEVWDTANAARHWQRATTGGENPIGTTGGENPMKDHHRDSAACAFRYRHPGERQKWRFGRFDPAACGDPRAWLEARLGPLAGFEIGG